MRKPCKSILYLLLNDVLSVLLLLVFCVSSLQSCGLIGLWPVIVAFPAHTHLVFVL